MCGFGALHVEYLDQHVLKSLGKRLSGATFACLGVFLKWEGVGFVSGSGYLGC